MSLNRHAKRRDANEPEIIKLFESMGASVYPMDRPVDLLVGYMGRTAVVEVKMPKGKQTPNQVDFFASWKGQKAEVRDELGVKAVMEYLKGA